jgi:hypothetical protein
MIIYNPEDGKILFSTTNVLTKAEVKNNLALYPGCKSLEDKSVESLSGYFITTKNKVATKPNQPDSSHVWEDRKWVLKADLQAEAIVFKRNKLLADSDWTQLPDVTTPKGWVTYRQALRDITDQTGFPNKVIWPATPV